VLWFRVVTAGQIVLTIVLAAGGYLLGAVPFALLVARGLHGVDVRERGTGNVGAGNVRRVLGVRAGALVMACDRGKGFLPSLAVVLLLPSWPTALVAFTPVFGHQHSIFPRDPSANRRSDRAGTGRGARGQRSGVRLTAEGWRPQPLDRHSHAAQAHVHGDDRTAADDRDGRDAEPTA
jgi:hypothetical protein